jgi:cell division protein ZapA (FtsZ GTPase activity inhibitor)
MDKTSADKHISLTIAGKAYPVVVNEEEAKYIREIERRINEDILSFQTKYAGITTNDCMAMLLISKNVEFYQYQIENENLNSQLDELNEALTKAQI